MEKGKQKSESSEEVLGKFIEYLKTQEESKDICFLFKMEQLIKQFKKQPIETSDKSDSKKKEENEWLDWWKQLKEDHNKKKIEFLYPMARDKKAYEELSKKLCSLHKPIYDVVSIVDVHQLLLNLGIVMSITDINDQFVKMHQSNKREII